MKKSHLMFVDGYCRVRRSYLLSLIRIKSLFSYILKDFDLNDTNFAVNWCVSILLLFLLEIHFALRTIHLAFIPRPRPRAQVILATLDQTLRSRANLEHLYPGRSSFLPPLTITGSRCLRTKLWSMGGLLLRFYFSDFCCFFYILFFIYFIFIFPFVSFPFPFPSLPFSFPSLSFLFPSIPLLFTFLSLPFTFLSLHFPFPSLSFPFPSLSFPFPSLHFPSASLHFSFTSFFCFLHVCLLACFLFFFLFFS